MNIVLIVADDMRFDMLGGLPSIQTMMDEEETTQFTNGFNANPVCCASRATILTGNRSMTTKVYGNSPPVGGYQIFDDSNTIATALQGFGYTNGIFGKYMNDYNDDDASYIAPGWDRWWAITARGDEYYGYGVSNDGTLKVYGDDPHEYLTDVIARESEHFIATAQEPFFAYIVPTSPHKEAIPADRHLGSNRNLVPFEPASLNEADVSDKAAWMQKKKLLTQEVLDQQQALRLNQYQTLHALDDLIFGTMTALSNRGILDDTMVVFISDNGYLWGEHRLTGKSVPYIEATRMPMVVRFPEPTLPVKEQMLNKSTPALVQNLDLAPTFAEIAGIDFPCDGKSFIPLLFGGPGPEDVFIEHHEQGPVPAFAIVQRRNWQYTWLGTREEELYHLLDDPLQMKNEIGHYPKITEELRAACRNYLVSLPPGMESRP